MNIAVVHAGALGDSVLVWPLLRAMARQEHVVKLVTADSLGRLAAVELNRELGAPVVTHVALDGPHWTPLWRGERVPAEQGPAIDLLVSFLADDSTEGGRRWLAAAREAFPAAEVLIAGPPGSVTRGALWRRLRVQEFGNVEPGPCPRGPAVFSVGAGGKHKRWPLARWGQLFDLARAAHPGLGIQVIAGPVEQDVFSKSERAAFDGLVRRGRWSGFVERLSDLANVVRMARCVVSADSGPAHLAAQLGAPTLALFGPTDAAVWSPVGPRVRTLAPAEAVKDMSWLTPQRVMETLTALGWLR
ncbi:MAG: glycosyltransferase family 9 protein [Phycisphaerales bacterium]|nr:glycosyltransferase family 9 protein [Phycisphaerales bacterium]